MEKKKILNQMIYKLDDYCFGPTVESLVLELSNHNLFEFFFGDLSKNQKVESLLLDKFLFNRYYSDITTLKNIIKYTSSLPQNQNIFLEFFSQLLSSWSNRSFIKYRSYEHSFYISQGVMLSYAALQRNKSLIEDVKATVDRCLMKGLPHYLGSSQDDLRQMGMVVAVTLVTLVPREGITLELPYKDCDVTRELLCLSVGDDEDDGVDGTSVHGCATEQNEDGTEEESKEEGKKERVVIEELDSDDDEDLVPISGLPKLRSKKQPHYLGECLEGLVSTEDAELAEECLKACEKMVEKNKGVTALHKEMCGVLLRLQDSFSIEGFEEMRMRSMLKLLVVSPAIVAEFLSGEFYAPEYCLKHRCDILDVLVQGAQALSVPEGERSPEGVGAIQDHTERSLRDTEKVEKSFDQMVISGESEHSNHSDWRQVVAERIEKKTRRFGGGRSNKVFVEGHNRLAPVVGWFFYPLMKNFDRSDASINLLGPDHLVLQKLLMSLANILHHSHNILSAGELWLF